MFCLLYFFVFPVTNRKPSQLSITKVKQFQGSSAFTKRSMWTIDQLQQINGIDPNRVSMSPQLHRSASLNTLPLQSMGKETCFLNRRQDSLVWLLLNVWPRANGFWVHTPMSKVRILEQDALTCSLMTCVQNNWSTLLIFTKASNDSILVPTHHTIAEAWLMSFLRARVFFPGLSRVWLDVRQRLRPVGRQLGGGEMHLRPDPPSHLSALHAHQETRVPQLSGQTDGR